MGQKIHPTGFRLAVTREDTGTVAELVAIDQFHRLLR